MIETLLDLDKELLLFLNGLHSPFFDVLVWWITKLWVWIPVFVLVSWFLWRYYRKKVGLVIAFCLLSIVFSDQISGFIKNKVERLRPSHNMEISDRVHLHVSEGGNVYKGGKYGFVSAHAANSFALAVLLIYFFKPICKRARWIFVLCAVMFSYTRIYLGVHYFGDIICGALLGVCCGLFAVWLYKLSQKNFNSSIT